MELERGKEQKSVEEKRSESVMLGSLTINRNVKI